MSRNKRQVVNVGTVGHVDHAVGKSEYSAVLSARIARLETNLIIAAPVTAAFGLLALFDIIHWAMWLPAAIAGTGLVTSLAMQLNRVDELRRGS